MPPGGTTSAEAEREAPDVDAEVLVVGAGPVGCWLAAELSGAGVRVLVIEARESRAAWSRGFVVHPRTLEIFDSRGVAQRLLADGRMQPTWHFAMSERRLDFSILPTPFPFALLQPQARTEELLEEHLIRQGGYVLRGRRAVDVTQHPDHVAVRVRNGEAEHTLTARFVVGCDGARSAVRQEAGIGFSGSPDTMTFPHTLVELSDPPPPEQYMQTRERGAFFAIALPDGRFVVSTVDHACMHAVESPWTAEAVRASLLRITGTDYGMGEPERISVLGNSAKQAHRYRDRRVLLAGDAAHVHYPMGGQGMNLGIQDAHNLAWRLTAAVRAERERPSAKDAARLPEAVDALLDGYEAERRPVGGRVLEDVQAQVALVAATGADGVALRSRFAALLSEHPAVHLEYALRLSGLSVRYPRSAAKQEDADARLGARIPDLLLEPAAGDGSGPAGGTRLYDLLREIGPGRFVRLSVSGGDRAAGPEEPARFEGPTRFEEPTGFEESGSKPDERPAAVTARSVLGPDWALRAGWGRAETVLIRPDGHIVDIRGRTAAPRAEGGRAP